MVSTAKLVTTPARIEGEDLKLDLACGNNKREGFLGVDKFATDATDHTFDLLTFPWPIADGAVAEVHCSHFFEHIPGQLRPRFMDEVYRVLKTGGQAVIITPYWSSMRSIQDFTHEWPPVCEASFMYFNKGWRETNKLTHGAYNMKCDFDFGYGWTLDNDITVRHQDAQQFSVKHYNNAVLDVHVTLTKRG
jgi:SAM-dependent methyltransferase